MPRVWIAGSINMDVIARTERHPQAGETLLGTDLCYAPGGKGANQAVAAVRLGALTTLVGRVGNDAFGDELVRFLQREGVEVGSVLRVPLATGRALIVVAATAENTIVVVPGANTCLGPRDVRGLVYALGDVLLSQFEIPLNTIEQFFKSGRAAGATTILNPSPARACEALLDLVDILVLNETELAFLRGSDLPAGTPVEEIARVAVCLRTSPRQKVVVTLGANGVLACFGERTLHIPGRRVEAVDTTGAGDCFVGALSAQLARGVVFEDALVYANIAASLCVQKRGAAPSLPDAKAVADVLAELRL